MNNISFEQTTAFMTLGDFYDFGSHEMSLGVPPMYATTRIFRKKD